MTAAKIKTKVVPLKDEQEAKAARAYVEFKNGTIQGLMLIRLASGRIAVKKMPVVIED